MKNRSRVSLVGKPLSTYSPLGPLRKCPKCGRSGAYSPHLGGYTIIHSYERRWGTTARYPEYHPIEHCQVITPVGA